MGEILGETLRMVDLTLRTEPIERYISLTKNTKKTKKTKLKRSLCALCFL